MGSVMETIPSDSKRYQSEVAHPQTGKRYNIMLVWHLVIPTTPQTSSTCLLCRILRTWGLLCLILKTWGYIWNKMEIRPLLRSVTKNNNLEDMGAVAHLVLLLSCSYLASSWTQAGLGPILCALPPTHCSTCLLPAGTARQTMALRQRQTHA